MQQLKPIVKNGIERSFAELSHNELMRTASPSFAAEELFSEIFDVAFLRSDSRAWPNVRPSEPSRHAAAHFPQLTSPRASLDFIR
jgi:hypothetical protein